MKKVIAVCFLLLFCLSVFGCVSFLNMGKFYIVFTETREDARRNYFYKGGLYSGKEIDDLRIQTEGLSSREYYFIGNNNVSVDIPYDWDCENKDMKKCKDVLASTLGDLKEDGIIKLSDGEVSEILEIAKTNNIIIKNPWMKIGSLESKKSKWISYYNGECYTTADIKISPLILFGANVIPATISPMMLVALFFTSVSLLIVVFILRCGYKVVKKYFIRRK